MTRARNLTIAGVFMVFSLAALSPFRIPAATLPAIFQASLMGMFHVEQIKKRKAKRNVPRGAGEGKINLTEVFHVERFSKGEENDVPRETREDNRAE